MATGHAELVCFLNGHEVTKLDFWNSDLTSIDSLTYSSTLGLICGTEIHGCGMAEVVKNQGTGRVKYAMRWCLRSSRKFQEIQVSLYIKPGEWEGGWMRELKEFLHEDVALGQTPRHQGVGWKVWWSEIVQVRLWGAWILVTLETTRKLHAVNFCKDFWGCYLGHPRFFLRLVLSDRPKFVAFLKKK